MSERFERLASKRLQERDKLGIVERAGFIGVGGGESRLHLGTQARVLRRAHVEQRLRPLLKLGKRQLAIAVCVNLIEGRTRSRGRARFLLLEDSDELALLVDELVEAGGLKRQRLQARRPARAARAALGLSTAHLFLGGRLRSHGLGEGVERGGEFAGAGVEG